MRRTEDEDRSWTIPFKDIQSVHREERSIVLSTHPESWGFLVLRGGIEYLVASLELARSGNLKKVINMGNIAGSPSAANSEDEIFEKIEKLGSLKEKGIITH